MHALLSILVTAVSLAQAGPAYYFAQNANTPSSSSSSSSVSATVGTPAPSPSPLVKPSGGIGFNTTPTYKPRSDFDFQSMYLGLHQELIELDLFHHGLATFSPEQFAQAGLSESDQFLIQFMAEQELGHATMFINMLGTNLSAPCTYSYPNFTSVRDFFDFSRLVTRFGESGTIGFLGHLDAQDSASLINDAIQTEGRQQMVFRQFEGLFPMPFWFSTSITQSMQWTLLAPYIATCPADAPKIPWTAFPALNVTNNPQLIGLDTNASISTNLTAFTSPGSQVNLTWDNPGKQTGWNNSYTTQSLSNSTAKWVAWISQLNTTYTPLTVSNISSDNASSNINVGSTVQPSAEIYGANSFSLLNGTVYLLITDEDIYVTPYNLSEIEAHIIAGPALYNVG